MQVPSYVEVILNKLINKGHQAWVVGGAVRDMLLGQQPDDYDIATTALPDEVEHLFDKTIPTGIKHGTVTVLIDNQAIEVTTLRSDGEYSDSRHPDRVSFTTDILQDLKRRDFTINAMAYSNRAGVLDPYCGQQDLNQRLIRCVGDPAHRFAEDALRMLRAVRFAVSIDGKIEHQTYVAIKQHAKLLSKVSNERISSEMQKILGCPYPSRGIRLLIDTELIDIVLPEIKGSIDFDQQNPYHDKTVLEHILAVVDCVNNTPTLRLAALLHDIGKPQKFSIDNKGIGHFYGHEISSAEIAEQVLIRWCIPKKQINVICMLIRNHMRTYGSYKPVKVKKFIADIGEELLEDLFKLMIADKVGKRPPYDFSKIYRLKFMCEKIIYNKEPLYIRDLAVSGNDLQKLGLQGEMIGKTLNKLLDIVLAKPALNERNTLLRYVKQWEYLGEGH